MAEFNATAFPEVTNSQGFWVTVASATIASVIAGLLLLWLQHRLALKSRRDAYAALRQALIDDVLHNLKLIDLLWTDAREPYHSMPPGDTKDWLPSGKSLHTLGGKPHAFHIETWDLARNHLLAMTDNPTDGTRFAKAFQIFRDCAIWPESLGSLEPLRKWSYYEPNTIIQPTVLTSQGHQLHAVPNAVFQVTHMNQADIKKELVSLVEEYGTREQIAQAKTIEDRKWGEGSWSSEDRISWIPSKWNPRTTSTNRES